MVEAVLRNIPETRNSDIRLTIEIWRRYFPSLVQNDGAILHQGVDPRPFVFLSDLFDLPREDNIKRVRAALNHEGKYFPTDWKVAKARGIAEDEWRQALGYPTKAATQNPTQDDSYMDTERSFKNNTLPL